MEKQLYVVCIREYLPLFPNLKKGVIYPVFHKKICACGSVAYNIGFPLPQGDTSSVCSKCRAETTGVQYFHSAHLKEVNFIQNSAFEKVTFEEVKEMNPASVN